MWRIPSLSDAIQTVKIQFQWKQLTKEHTTTKTEDSVKLVLIVHLIISKMTVKPTWLDITALKEDEQNDTDKFVNSGMLDKANV